MSNPIHHTANNREFLLVEVPKDIVTSEDKQFKIDSVDNVKFLRYWTPVINGFYNRNSIAIPTGSYKVLFLADKATEEQAKEVVFDAYSAISYNSGMWLHYDHNIYILNDAKSSLKSLITAHFPSTPNRILILGKIN